jgi:diguanylate cyclase (GGDEF)-like protein
MNQSKCSQRDWRVDLSNAAASVVSQAPDEANPEPIGCPPKPSRLAAWRKSSSRWTKQVVTRLLARLTPGASMARDELILHTMARTLDRCDRPEQVRQALIESIAQLIGSSEIHWAREANQNSLGRDPSSSQAPEGEPTSAQIDPHGPKYTELVVRAGCKSKGVLRVFSTPGRSPAWTEATLLRMGTLCSHAASAMDRLELQFEMDGEERTNGNQCYQFSDEQSCEFGDELTGGGQRALPYVQDATFLNAVLPYVMIQARRYREPVSLMCVAVDRLNGIRNLLGLEQADRAVREVGLHIAGAIRASDVVARIDDDRIIAVLPRASLHDAWRVANNVCHAIEQCHPLSPELPLLTVSAGVAEYPSCASSVYGLIDSADHALSMAQAQGRNRAVAANLLTEPASQALAQCSG